MDFLACSVCYFGPPDDPMNMSLRGAIMAMFAVLAVVLGLLAKFFLSVRKRSRLMNQTVKG